MKNFVCVETSSTRASLALYWNGQIQAQHVSAAARGHSEFLLQTFQSFFVDQGPALHELEGLCITNGPGSFTGLRVATSFAKTLCYSLNLKCWVTTSTAPLSFASQFDGPRLVVLNAFKNLVYVDQFKDRTQHTGPSVVDLEQLPEWVQQLNLTQTIQVVGDGQTLFASHLSDSQKKTFQFDSSLTHASANVLGKLYLAQPQAGQTMDWKAIIPLYIRGSEAEESLREHQSGK